MVESNGAEGKAPDWAGDVPADRWVAQSCCDPAEAVKPGGCCGESHDAPIQLLASPGLPRGREPGRFDELIWMRE